MVVTDLRKNKLSDNELVIRRLLSQPKQGETSAVPDRARYIQKLYGTGLVRLLWSNGKTIFLAIIGD